MGRFYFVLGSTPQNQAKRTIHFVEDLQQHIFQLGFVNLQISLFFLFDLSEIIEVIELARFGHYSVLDQEDLICIFDGTQSMGNADDCHVLVKEMPDSFKRVLDFSLGAWIEC